MGTRRKRPSERLETEIRFRGRKLDAERLEALARREELTGSEVLRRLIREAYEKQGGGK